MACPENPASASPKSDVTAAKTHPPSDEPKGECNTSSPQKPSSASKKHLLCNATQPSAKRRRQRWADIVEELALANGIEEDSHRLSQRQKQIDFGKNTLAYDRFNKILPREKRVKGDPMTPIVRQKCSKRSFMGQVTSWKKRVYAFVKALEEVREENGALQNNEEEQKEQKERVQETNDAGSKDCSTDEHVGSEHDEDPLDDMDDIQLDDFGNVIQPATEPTTPPKQTSYPKQNTPPSIFDAY